MVFLYVEINTTAILILVMLLYNLRGSGHRMPDEKLFRCLLWATIAVLLCDMVGWTVNGQTFPAARSLNAAANTFYFFLTGLIAFLWLLYADYKLHEDRSRLRRICTRLSLPFLLLAAASLTTPLTGWLFTIDGSGYYQRGSGYWFQTLVAWFYLVCPTVSALRRLHRGMDRASRQNCVAIVTFAVIPFICSIIQTLFYGIPLVWIGITLALLLTFINIQNRQISLDGLTGINNRGQLNKYLSARMADTVSEGTLFLILLDLDQFKTINDTCGHSVGDATLVLTAELLKTVCGRNARSTFLARYGGDEFAIVCCPNTEEQVCSLIDGIQAEACRVFQSDVLPCRPRLSIGYAAYHPEQMPDIDDLIAAADARMYQAKATHKQFLS